mmetsp:Transcript_62933/g.149179  ORF Transcript_62933/g.149179 Transcript_62933/m.149179 type:complete len:151 (-) Transcript_62933:146-598(-)
MRTNSALVGLACVAMACIACLAIATSNGSARRTELFTIDDFDSGRVGFPEQGMRGHRQVVKSLDTNLNLGDHKWEHQTHVAEAPMQEWPMSTAGMKGNGARKVQLSALPPLPKGLRAMTKMNAAQQKAAADLAKVGRALDHSVAPAGHYI